MKNSKRHGSKVQLNHLKNGDVTYYVVYKSAGKTYRVKIGRKSEGITEAKCIERRNTILSEIRHGSDVSGPDSKRITFDQLAEQYFLHGGVHHRSNDKYSRIYENHVKPFIGEKQVMRLSDSDILAIQRIKRGDDLADATVNAIVKLIKRIVSMGVKRGAIPYSPFKNISLFKLDNARQRYLSLKEIEALYESLKDDADVSLFVRMSLNLGARANSILNVKVSDINVEGRTVQLYDYKRHNTYIGFISDELAPMLFDRIKWMPASHYVVSCGSSPMNYNTLHYRLSQAFEPFNIGISTKDRKNRVVIHTLRHTFASHLAINGTPIQTIQKLMNHKDINMSLQYAKLSPDIGRAYIDDLYHNKG